MDAQEVMTELQPRLNDFAEIIALVRFDLGEDGSFEIDGREGTPEMREATEEEAKVTFRTSSENLVKILKGELNPMMAFTLGKLKIDGSMGLAMKISTILEE
jgi:putative sterol carrier protein